MWRQAAFANIDEPPHYRYEHFGSGKLVLDESA